MTPEDRDILLSLRRQQADLQRSLDKLNAQLGELEGRTGGTVAVEELHAHLRPLPLEAILPPIPTDGAPLPVFTLPPIPADAVLPPVPPDAAPRRSLESRFGSWLVRLGALFGVIALALILAWPRVQEVLGHAGLLALSAAASLGVVLIGDRMARRGGAALFFGRVIAAVALAWLYLTAYATYFYEPLQVTQSPLIAGLLLLAWSIYTLHLAERRKSQSLGLFAIALAYLGTAINPVGHFTMGADIFLAVIAATFLLLNGWSMLAIFGVIGTYLALLRRLVLDSSGDLVLDTSRMVSLTPYAIYLVMAWLIFTGAIILNRAATFRGGWRFAVVSLNNAALAVLLALTCWIAGYGFRSMGWALLDTGLVFLVTSRFAGRADFEPVELMGAYAAQGLALFTGGIIIIFTGVTRAALLLVETFLIGIAGAFSGDRILTISTYAAGFFATIFLGWEIAVNAHHPWLFGFGGALVMLICAWNSRSEVRNGPMERSTVVVSATCYCLMAIGLVYAALSSEMSDAALPPALALAALAFTFLIYYFSLYELPALAQILLIAALILVLFPTENGEELPWWSMASVGAITLLLVTWWSRQRVTRSGAWTVVLTFIYALALADLAHLVVRPYVGAEGWIVGASLLSVAFLIYGALARVWSIAAVGQVFLALALYHFFFPPQAGVFPWSFWVAAVPVMVLYTTARAAHEWLRNFSDFPETYRQPIAFLAYAYQLLAVVAVARGVFGLALESEQIASFLLLGTLVLSLSVRHSSTFGVRCSFILSAIGMWLYFDNLAEQAHVMATTLNGVAMILFLAQPALLRHEGKSLVTRTETWALVLFAVLTNWIFVSAWIVTRDNPAYLATAWGVFALFLFLFGANVRERRISRCGMAVLIAAILRVVGYDVWKLSSGYLILTIVLLALILLIVGSSLLLRTERRRLP